MLQSTGLQSRILQCYQSMLFASEMKTIWYLRFLLQNPKNIVQKPSSKMVTRKFHLWGNFPIAALFLSDNFPLKNQEQDTELNGPFDKHFKSLFICYIHWDMKTLYRTKRLKNLLQIQNQLERLWYFIIYMISIVQPLDSQGFNNSFFLPFLTLFCSPFFSPWNNFSSPVG